MQMYRMRIVSRISAAKKLQYTAQWDADPVRTVVHLVRDFVERFLQEMRIEQHLQFSARLRQMRGIAAFGEIRAQERGAHPSIPEVRSTLDRRRILGTYHRVLRLPEQHRMRRVVEGAEHAGHVAQGAALDAALAQWPRRLALEIDDDEVVARVQHLAEVIVAMGADAQTCNAAIENAPNALLYFFFAREQFLRCRNSFAAPPQQLECAHRLRADVLI